MKKPLTEAERQALARFKATLQSLLGDKLLSIRLFGSRARDESLQKCLVSYRDTLIKIKRYPGLLGSINKLPTTGLIKETLLCFGSLRLLARDRRESVDRWCRGLAWCCGRHESTRQFVFLNSSLSMKPSICIAPKKADGRLPSESVCYYGLIA